MGYFLGFVLFCAIAYFGFYEKIYLPNKERKEAARGGNLPKDRPGTDKKS